jgi:putative flippase GtrA
MILGQALFFRIIKFCIAGATGVVVDFGITILLKERLGLHKYLSSAFGFVIAASANFAINRFWTFHNTDPDWISQFLRFFGVATIGLSISLLITYLLSEKLKFNFYLAKALSIGGSMVWNFLGNSFFTFGS